MKAFIKLLFSFTWLFLKFGWSIRPRRKPKVKKVSHLASTALLRHPTQRTTQQLRVMRGRDALHTVARKKREFIQMHGRKPNMVTMQKQMWNHIKEFVMVTDGQSGHLDPAHTKLLGMRVQFIPVHQAQYMPHDMIVIGHEPQIGSII